MDKFIEDLFMQEFFTIAFGIVLWFAILWSIDNKKWTFKAWLKDQMDEIFIVTLVGFSLVSFDDVVVRYLHNSYGTDIEFNKLVYLLSGPITLGILKIVQKLRK